jgi:hypothetical protein
LLRRPGWLVRVAIVLKPSTLLRFHRALTTRKYRHLFSSTGQKKPGPNRPLASIAAAGGARASLGSHRWQPHCRGLYQTPVAA